MFRGISVIEGLGFLAGEGVLRPRESLLTGVPYKAPGGRDGVAFQ